MIYNWSHSEDYSLSDVLISSLDTYMSIHFSLALFLVISISYNGKNPLKDGET